MAKPSNREKILTEGLRVVHARGFANASVRDIVQAAGVPQGSFTNHFASKEAFGLEILEIYFANNCKTMAATLRNEALPPLQRLRAYIDAVEARLSQHGMRNGCLYGNMAAEASDHSEPLRTRLVEIFAEGQAAIADCLKAAVKAGELPASFECDEVAGFILSSLQGAELISKAERSAVPVERFKQMLFSTILR
ncbi:MAG TPA: TetR family transcriptional regulator C-terminal domain-containing protein [Alphaproteobacteria bacterium]